VQQLRADASKERVELRTSRRTEAMTLLGNAGATVAATSEDTLTIAGLDSESIAGLLARGAVPFSELRQHRASLEEAYMELTREAAEFAHPTDGAPQ